MTLDEVKIVNEIRKLDCFLGTQVQSIIDARDAAVEQVAGLSAKCEQLEAKLAEVRGIRS
jgi:hypothetical protein